MIKYLLLIVNICLLVSCKEQQSIIERPPIYNEPHRPQFHFSPEAHWMNDPNGLVYYDGEYHLFYQYYPEDIVWGPMHWGHAVSRDMIHWSHLPIALYPDSLGLIFSGSAVIDQDNTAGFGKDAMVAIFTHHNMDLEKAGSKIFQNQSIAYSTDRGRTFTKFDGNPVIKNPGIKDFRDPKVRWDDTHHQWVMVFAAYDKALFYTSKNLKDWRKSGEFGIPGDTRLWECPDLFPIKVEETGDIKWILITSIQKDAPNGGTATSYFVGDFDGAVFKGDTAKQYWLDYGKDNYAFVTWNNVPDDRTLGIGWMSNWQYAQKVPTEKWRSATTLPRSLSLHFDGTEFSLRSMPVAEIEQLYEKPIILSPAIIKDKLLVSQDTICNQCVLDLQFKKPTTGVIKIRIANSLDESITVGYNITSNQYFIDRSSSGASDFSKDFVGVHLATCNYQTDTIQMKIFLDKSSIELFADDGRTVMTDIMFPSIPYSNIEIFGDSIALVKGRIHPLRSIWRQ